MKLLRDVVEALKVTVNLPEVSSTIEVLLDKIEKDNRINEEFSQALDVPKVLGEKFEVSVVVVIDEFQYLRLAKQNLPGIFHKMRSKWQFHKNVEYVVSGSEIGLLQEIVENKEEPFYLFFYMVEIKPFERDTSIFFLEEGFRAEKIKKEVSREDIERLVDFVDGFPAWLNLVGIKIAYENWSVNKVISELPKDENEKRA